MPTAISWGNFQILWWQSPHWSRKLSSSPMNICQLWLQCSKCAWGLFSEPRPEPPRTSHLHRTERCQWSWSLILIRLRRTRRNPTCTWMYICIFLYTTWYISSMSPLSGYTPPTTHPPKPTWDTMRSVLPNWEYLIFLVRSSLCQPGKYVGGGWDILLDFTDVIALNKWRDKHFIESRYFEKPDWRVWRD